MGTGAFTQHATRKPTVPVGSQYVIRAFLCLVLLLSSLAWPAPAHAQPSRAGGPNSWRHYAASSEGLPSNKIQAIAYSEDLLVDVAVPGLWVGTDAGLSYTNGRDWLRFDSGLPGDDVRAIVHGRQDGKLWVATTSGVARLNYTGAPLDEQHVTISPVLTSADLPRGWDVFSLALGRDDNQLWVGTDEGLALYNGVGRELVGLYGSEIRDLVYDAERDTLWIATPKGLGRLDQAFTNRNILVVSASDSQLPDDDVYALELGDDGRVWIATAGGLAALSPDGTWRTWTPGKPGLPNYPLTDLSFDPTGRYLWVATAGGGASRYDVHADHWMRFNTLGSDLLDDHVSVVLASHQGTAWLGTRAGLSGVVRSWETYSFLSPRVPGKLASNRIQAGWVDPTTGTLWVGTEGGGVSRSDDDGETWQTFSTAHGLGANVVNALWGNGAGVVWVGTPGGVSRSDDGGATWQTFATGDGRAIWGDDAGALWVGTWGGGVSRSADGGTSWQPILTTNNGLRSNNVHALWMDDAGALWVCTDDGVSYVTDTEISSQAPPTMIHSLESSAVRAVWGDGAGAVWVGADDGLHRSDDGGTTWQTFTSTHGLESDDVRAVWGGGAGGVWAGTWGGGVSRSDDGGMSWQTFTTTHGLASDYVSSVWGNDAGVVWVGTEGGFSRSDDGGATWQTFSTVEVLGSNNALSVWGNGAGVLWVGTNSRVHRSEDAGATWQTFSTAHGLGGNNVSSVWGDNEGGVWLGTDGGVSRSDDDGRTWRTFNTTHGLGADFVTSMWGDSAGVVWVGTDDGVSRSDDEGNTWRTFGTDEGLGDNAVRSVWGDEQGSVWVGTLGGVSRSDDGGETWQNFTIAAEVLDNAVSSVWGDGAGTVWAGTVGGVSRSDDGGTTWRTFTTTHGLGADFVSAVWGDGAGVVWAGTTAGVSRSDDGGTTWQNFGAAEGLGSDGVNSVWGDGAGVVWVGTEGGGVSRLVSDASPLPVAGWLEPDPLGSTSSYRLLDSRKLKTGFAGLSLAPAGGSDQVYYSVILSPTTAAGQIISRPFPAPNDFSKPDVVAQVALGSETEPLAFGGYELTLTAKDWYGNSSVTRRAIQVQARPIINAVVLYWEGESLGTVSPSLPVPTPLPLTPTPLPPTPTPLQPTPTLPQSPLVFTSPLLTPTAAPTLAPTPILTGTVKKLTTDSQGRLTLLTATLTITDLDSPRSNLDVFYTWKIPGLKDEWHLLQEGGVITASRPISNAYALAFRAADPDNNYSLELQVSVQVNIPPAPTPTPAAPIPTATPFVIIEKETPTTSPLVLLFNLLLFAAAAGLVIFSLRHYLAYAGAWAAAQEYPLQQIIPLVAKRGESVDEARLYPTLQELQAFSTNEQVRDALAALAERGLLRREGQAYRFVSPWPARVHYWLQRRRIPALAERIRTQHPLYERARGFFDQAHFRMGELGAQEYMLYPQGSDHPQARHGALYARLITGRPTSGDDFTAVYQAAQEHYGADLTHRVAVVISDQRPEPGARYRLYEIRQREGLAIVPLDSALFGQIKPNRTASDILAAEIDQATGQQNLYAISGPVSGDLSFFGRERVLQEVIDLLDAGQPVGIFGLRKVGKTSLIQRLQGRLSLQRPIAFVDTQSTLRQQGVWPLYAAIVEAFVEHLQRYRSDLALPELRLHPRAEESGPEAADAFMQDLQALHEALGRPNAPERMLLIVDEVDRLVPTGEASGYEGLTGFFGQLRAANQQARLLDLMLVGVDPAINRRERWQDHDNELYRALREVWMPPMTPKDVREMIESLGLQMGVRYMVQALARLARAGGGHPFVTRQMCSLVVQDRLGTGAITIMPPEADAAIEEFIFQDHYLPEMWRTRLDEAQRDILRQLAQAEAPIPRAELLPASQRQAALAALTALEERTLAVREDAGYVIAWDVLRDWIRWVELGIGD